MFIQPLNFVHLILSFENHSFEINPASLASKAEKLAIRTSTVDPIHVKDREAPTANPLLSVRNSHIAIWIFFFFNLLHFSIKYFYQHSDFLNYFPNHVYLF